jgi:hypothetical protein
MSSNDWEQTLDELKQEIASIKGRAGTFSTKFEEVRRQAESFKIAFLNHRLEAQRRSLARTRGYTSIMRDGKRLGASLGAAAAGLIFGGIITRDKFAAVNAGLSSFDATLQGLGDTAWAVSLGEDLRLVPKDNITLGQPWVTWESLKNALTQLEREASQGVALGSLDSIISRLQRRRELIYLGLLEAKPIRLERGKP